jgi:hypothetical protein
VARRSVDMERCLQLEAGKGRKNSWEDGLVFGTQCLYGGYSDYFISIYIYLRHVGRRCYYNLLLATLTKISSVHSTQQFPGVAQNVGPRRQPGAFKCISAYSVGPFLSLFSPSSRQDSRIHGLTSSRI